ncbi:MAG: ABC transporter substrate-binding protein [Prochloraceae cyanobacterium]
MSKSWLKFCLIFLISCFFFACASPSIQPKKSAIESPQRVVALTSLTADITEILAPNRLVGIVGNSLLTNDDRFKDIELVSQGQTPPNLEKIIDLQPDLVIGAAGFYSQTMAKLEELGIGTLETKVDSWERLLATTKTLGDRLDVDPQPLLNQYQSFIQDLPAASPSTLLIINNKPILSPNKNSWAGDLLGQFNAKNVTASIQGDSNLFRGYVTLSPETIIKTNPEVILVVNADPNILNKFKADPFWKELKATQSDRVYSFDYFGLVNPGSIEKIKETCTRLKQVLQEYKIAKSSRANIIFEK